PSLPGRLRPGAQRLAGLAGGGQPRRRVRGAPAPAEDPAHARGHQRLLGRRVPGGGIPGVTRGHRSWVAGLAGLVLLAGACSQSPAAVTKAATTGAFTGKLGAATYLVDIPAHWNGTLLLYSHGYATPTGLNPASDA